MTTQPNSTPLKRAGAKLMPRFGPGILVAPAVFWLVAFFLLPLLVILVYSFLTRSPTGAVAWTFTLENFTRLFSDTVYATILWRSLWVGFVTTLVCLLLGYPLALFIVLQPVHWRALLIFLILIPFWTNMLVRTYAWITILGNNGLINNLLMGLGGERITLLNTQGAVLIGLVYGQLPFMVLPLYASLERFDFRLLEAAGDLGANGWQAFRRVLLPLTMPGIVSGSVLVFILAAGNFIIPDLLGGNKVMMIGNLLAQQFGEAQNQPLGSATALLVMLLLTVAVVIYFRLSSDAER